MRSRPSQLLIWFRNTLGQKEALFPLAKDYLDLLQKCRGQLKNVLISFDEYEKAQYVFKEYEFDTLKREKFIEVLSKVGLDHNYFGIINNFDQEQKANFQVAMNMTKKISISKRGVYILSRSVQLEFGNNILNGQVGIELRSDSKRKYGDNTILAEIFRSSATSKKKKQSLWF